MPTLPNAERAYVAPEKITRYLLDEGHPVGGPKARFLQRFGFDIAAPDVLEKALLLHATLDSILVLPPDIHGTRYVISGPMPCPDGRLPTVKSVWIIGPGYTVPRFVTLMPD
jgi:hypothetical protein